MVPVRHVRAHRRPGDGVYLVQTTQTQLAVDEAAVDVGIDVVHIQLAGRAEWLEHQQFGVLISQMRWIPAATIEEGRGFVLRKDPCLSCALNVWSKAKCRRLLVTVRLRPFHRTELPTSRQLFRIELIYQSSQA